MKKNKRGQFYLLAAIIIIGVIAGFASIMIYYKEDITPIKVEDLKEELELESSKVIDHGTFKQKNSAELRDLVANFSEEFSEYSESPERSLFFVIGNPESGIVSNYTTESAGSVTVEGGRGEGKSKAPIHEKRWKVDDLNDYLKEGKNISIKGKKVKLKEGFNFYFVLEQRTSEGEKYITEGKTRE